MEALGGLHGLQPLAPVLEPDLNRARRHPQHLGERLALIEIWQRFLLEGVDQDCQLFAGDLAALRAWSAIYKHRVLVWHCGD